MRSKDLTPELRAVIRDWGMRHRIPGVHARGLIPATVIQAYFDNHPGIAFPAARDTGIDGDGDEPSAVAVSELEQADDAILAQVTLPAAVREWEDDLTQQVANAIGNAFAAGRAYERGLLTQALAPYLAEDTQP